MLNFSILNPTAPHSFVEDDIRYLSVAQYYYRHKVYDNNIKHQIINSSSSFDIQSYANSFNIKLVHDWPRLRKVVMRRALVLMLSQNIGARISLLNTNNQYIDMNIEDNFSSKSIDGEYRNRNDYFYTEDNLVGELYMELRKMLKEGKDINT